MRTLSALDLVAAWEAGRDRHPVDRALLLLALAYPELTRDQLSALTIGQRNSRLLALRVQVLGSQLNAYAECPQCRAALEFSIDAPSLRSPEPAERTFTLAVEGWDVHVRLPDSLDLAAISDVPDPDEARYVLLQRCVLEARQGERQVTALALPPDAVMILADAMSERDPQASTRFRLSCPACGHGWAALFDVVSYFWTEINAYAQRLLVEVHRLARAYGWREADILAMSSARRQFYLGLVGA
jgi:hypothetical protein